MKAFSLCVLLAIPLTTYAQQPDVGPAGPAPVQMQPDTSGQRLTQMLSAAAELERTGQHAQAAALRQQAEQERQALLRYVAALKAEVERIERIVGPHQQVMVHLRVMEVSLTKLKSLGIDATKLQAKAADGPRDPMKPNAATAFSVVENGSEALLIIESLRKRSLVKVLAEPTLVTISGQEATFHSGGKLAVPRPQQDGSQKVEYLPYGTELQLKPELLANRHIRLDARCRVSELDYANTTQVGKETVPGIRTHDIHTVAEIQNGHTLVISGLAQTRIEASAHGLPWISEIPYAGAIFRTVKETRNETMTLVTLTPELIQPIDANSRVSSAAPTATARPTDVSIRR
jgi:pilus assembly protein CpaC